MNKCRINYNFTIGISIIIFIRECPLITFFFLHAVKFNIYCKIIIFKFSLKYYKVLGPPPDIFLADDRHMF